MSLMHPNKCLIVILFVMAMLQPGITKAEETTYAWPTAQAGAVEDLSRVLENLQLITNITNLEEGEVYNVSLEGGYLEAMDKRVDTTNVRIDLQMVQKGRKLENDPEYQFETPWIRMKVYLPLFPGSQYVRQWELRTTNAEMTLESLTMFVEVKPRKGKITDVDCQTVEVYLHSNDTYFTIGEIPNFFSSRSSTQDPPQPNYVSVGKVYLFSDGTTRPLRMKLDHQFLNNSSTTKIDLLEDDRLKSLPFTKKIGNSIDQSMSEVRNDWEGDTDIKEEDYDDLRGMDMYWLEKHTRTQFWPYVTQTSYYIITPILEAFGIGFENTELTLQNIDCGMPFLKSYLCVQETENGNSDGPKPNGKYEVNDILTYVVYLKNTGFEDAIYNDVTIKLNNYLHYIDGSIKGPAGTVMTWDVSQRLLGWSNFPVQKMGGTAFLSFRARIDDNAFYLLFCQGDVSYSDTQSSEWLIKTDGNPDADGAQATQIRVEGVSNDNDNDGLYDEFERLLETDASRKDTDGGGVDDGEEIFIDFTDPVETEDDNSPSNDSDRDGIMNEVEADYGTAVKDADSDDDGLSDGDEIYLYTYSYFGYTEPVSLNGYTYYHLDPINPDTDGDGLQDGTELGIAEPEPGQFLNIFKGTDKDYFKPDKDPATTTDPFNPDTDGDGVLDGDEDFNHNGMLEPGNGETDPNDPSDVAQTATGKRESSLEGGGGCFVATAAFSASENNKPSAAVTTLCSFRDNYLLQTELGRAFVSMYYKTSPQMAEFIAAKESRKTITRALLAPAVIFAAYTKTLLMIVLLGMFLTGGVAIRKLAGVEVK